MPHIVSVQITDDGGKTKVIPFYVPATLTTAQVQAWLNVMLPKLDLVTGGKITKASIALSMTLPGGLKATPTADRPINWGANFGFDADGTAYRWTVRVPSIDAGLVTNEVITESGTIISDWVALLVTGDGTVAPTDAYDNDLTAYLDAVPSFHKR